MWWIPVQWNQNTTLLPQPYITPHSHCNITTTGEKPSTTRKQLQWDPSGMNPSKISFAGTLHFWSLKLKHTHTHTHARMCTHTHTHTHTHACAHTHIHTHTHTHACAQTHTHTHAHTWNYCQGSGAMLFARMKDWRFKGHASSKHVLCNTNRQIKTKTQDQGFCFEALPSFGVQFLT